MKRFFTLFAAVAMLFAAGCESAVDLSEVNDRLDSLEQRMSAVEALLKASEEGLCIVSVQQTPDGYVFFMSDGSQITVLHGKDGNNGENGGSGTAGDLLIESITVGENEVTFVLADGYTFSLPLRSALSVTFDENDICDIVPDNWSLDIHYTVESVITDNIVVEVLSSADIIATVVSESATRGYIHIETTTVTDGSRIVVLISNGDKTIIRSLSFAPEKIIISTPSTIRDYGVYSVSSKGGEVKIDLQTNIDFEIIIGNPLWISVVETRAMRDETIVLDIAENTTGSSRNAWIYFTDEHGNTLSRFQVVQMSDVILDNEIHYTSSDGNIVMPHLYAVSDNSRYPSDYSYNNFGEGVNLISNTYENGEGVMVFDNPVTEIGYNAFHLCTSLTNITIPESVTKIGEYAFGMCYSLTNITIPESVTEIGYNAFHHCTSLTNITIPESVTEIGRYAFANCVKLSEFRGKLASADGRCLIVDGVLKAFAPAGLTEYSIPYDVTAIGDSAFSYCSSLTSITIPESVTRIENGVFSGCSALASIYWKAVTPPAIVEGFSLINTADNGKIYVPYKYYSRYLGAGWQKSWHPYIIVGYDFDKGVVIIEGEDAEIDPEINGKKVGLTAEQLSSPYTHYSDGDGLEGLVDGETSTYWHSVYNSTPGDETYGYYIDIALDEPLNYFCFRYCTRSTNDNAIPSLVTIGGSHNGSEWTVLATDSECYACGRGLWAIIEAVGSASAEAYEYLRFGVTESHGAAGGPLKGETGGKSVGMSELQLYKLSE